MADFLFSALTTVRGSCLRHTPGNKTFLWMQSSITN